MTTVRLDDFPCADGLILDVGGGGEGIIARVKGSRVISIDARREELTALKDEALKLVMDAREMTFLDGSFHTATAFFMLMYVAPADKPKVLAEVYRVLRPGGRLLVWDTVIPAPEDARHKYFLLPLTVSLPDGAQVYTGYGVRLEAQTAAGMGRFAEEAGFLLLTSAESGGLFHLELGKPLGTG
jgi:ubiquinone/menaquinone biosynthesis C-methylase UbiE